MRLDLSAALTVAISAVLHAAAIPVPPDVGSNCFKTCVPNPSMCGEVGLRAFYRRDGGDCEWVCCFPEPSDLHGRVDRVALIGDDVGH
jgi:hypothetical protein